MWLFCFSIFYFFLLQKDFFVCYYCNSSRRKDSGYVVMSAVGFMTRCKTYFMLDNCRSLCRFKFSLTKKKVQGLSSLNANSNIKIRLPKEKDPSIKVKILLSKSLSTFHMSACLYSHMPLELWKLFSSYFMLMLWQVKTWLPRLFSFRIFS